MTDIPNTPMNAELAHRVHRRLAAETSMMNAKSVLMRFGGIGGLIGLSALGIGAGVALAMFGYSYVTDGTASAEKIAAAFQKALEKTTLNAKGEMSLAPDSKVQLAEGATVDMSPDATVKLEQTDPLKLDPNAKVRIDGLQQAFPRPTEEQLRGTGKSSPANVVTNYTVFKSVDFGKGEVVTGWNFTSSEQSSPSRQYCYFSTNVEDQVQVRVDLAADGRALPMKKPPAGFDVAAALSQCIWFNGGTTQRMSSPLTENEPRGTGRVY